MKRTYFDKDGNYGDPDSMVVVDTRNWTEADWKIIENSDPITRSKLALALSARDYEQLKLFDLDLQN